MFVALRAKLHLKEGQIEEKEETLPILVLPPKKIFGAPGTRVTPPKTNVDQVVVTLDQPARRREVDACLRGRFWSRGGHVEACEVRTENMGRRRRCRLCRVVGGRCLPSIDTRASPVSSQILHHSPAVTEGTFSAS